MDKNDSSRKIISFYPHRSIFFSSFWRTFHVLFLKKACFGCFSLESYFANWWVTTTDHSLQSVLYLYDSFFSMYVSPQMKNSSVMLLARSISAIITVPYLLTALSIGKWAMITGADLRLLLIIRRVISGCYSSFAEWLPNEKLPQNAFLKSKHENDMKMASKWNKNMLRQS